MKLPVFENPRRALAIWAVFFLLLIAAAELFNFGLRAYGRQQRERDYRTYLTAAEELMNRYDYRAALAQIDEAKRRNAGAPEPFAVCGHIRYQLKQWNQAITEYQGAISRGSRDEGVFLNVVWALIELNRYEEAAALGIKTLNAGFSMPALPRYIAEAYFRDKKTAEAAPYYEMALKGYPNDLYLLDHLSQSYKAAGLPDKAREIKDRIADIEASLNEPR